MLSAVTCMENHSTREAPLYYAAAGILPVCNGAPHHGDDDGGDPLVLLGSEPCARQGGRLLYGPFGGRRELCDDNDPRRTAWREFHEETGGAFVSSGGMPLLFDEAFFRQHCLTHCMYAEARYHLYVVRVPWMPRLPQFTDADAQRDATLNKRHLQWVAAEHVFPPSAKTPPLIPWIHGMFRQHTPALQACLGLGLRPVVSFSSRRRPYSPPLPRRCRTRVIRSWMPPDNGAVGYAQDESSTRVIDVYGVGDAFGANGTRPSRCTP